MSEKEHNILTKSKYRSAFSGSGMWRKTMLKKTSSLAVSAIIAAAYAALCLLLAPLSFAGLQVRVAEALCVLPFLFPQAVPGLTVGCLLANIIGVSMGLSVPADVIFGTLATLIASVATAKMPSRWLAPLPPVLCNALIVGIMLTVTLGGKDSAPLLYLYNVLSVGTGELIACFGLGLPLLLLFEKNPRLHEIVKRYRNL